MWFLHPSKKNQQPFQHNLQRGDHVIRWTSLLLYPIQVHGIVLSAGDDLITIVDFGVTANTTRHPNKKDKETVEEEEEESQIDRHQNNDEDHEEDATVRAREQRLLQLEEMVEQEDRDMIEACEKAHKNEREGLERLRILTLTEEEEIRPWRKVNYGESLKKQGGWRWWKNEEDDKEDMLCDEGGKHDDDVAAADDDDDDDNPNTTEDKTVDMKRNGTNDSEEISEQSPSIRNNDHVESKSNKHENNNSISNTGKTETQDQEDNNEKTKKTQRVPQLPKSDPINLVLSRVRYLLSNPSILPPHHILFSNSECIAVWCKTGRWSTLQASIFLHSTAAGNFKSAATLATAVGTSTVVTTVPASGIAGWFGMTTTATVSLVSVQPWLIPALAGYGIIAVGAPYVLLKKAKERWELNTAMLTDGFWSWADVDVYVEAIKSWSSIE